MPSDNERMAALNQMLARGGQGMPGENQGYYDSIVRPVLSAPQGDRVAMADRTMADRNRIVAEAARHMVGGYGSALNSARQQTESEWMRRYLEGLKPSGKGPTKSGGKKDEEPTTLPTTTSGESDWSWVNDYVTSTSPSAPPGYKPDAPITALNRPGGGRGGGTTPRPQPRPRALPRVVNY